MVSFDECRSGTGFSAMALNDLKGLCQEVKGLIETTNSRELRGEQEQNANSILTAEKKNSTQVREW